MLIAASLLAWPLFQSEPWLQWLAGGTAACAAIWLLGLWQNRPGLATPCFIALCLFNILSLVVTAIEAGTGLLCQVLFLGSWDLNYLAVRVDRLAVQVDTDAYVTRHLGRLAVILVAGFAGGWIPLRLNIAWPFVPTLIVSLVCVLVLYWFMDGVRKLGSGV